MASYTSVQSGDWDNVDTWGGGGFPTSADTATIANTHEVLINDDTGDELIDDLTIDAGGILTISGSNGNKFTSLGPVDINGRFNIFGSGSSATPTEFEYHDGSTNCDSATAIIDVEGTTEWDVILRAESGGRFMGSSTGPISATFDKVKVTGTSNATYIMSGFYFGHYGHYNIGDILFTEITSSTYGMTGFYWEIPEGKTVTVSNCTDTNIMLNCLFWGDGTFQTINIPDNNKQRINQMTFAGNLNVVTVEPKINTIYNSYFKDNVTLYITDIQASSSLYGNTFLDSTNVVFNSSSAVTARLSDRWAINTNGTFTFSLTGSNYELFCAPYCGTHGDIYVTVDSNAILLTSSTSRDFMEFNHTRDTTVQIVGASSITTYNNTASLKPNEPIFYKNDATDLTTTMQCDFYPDVSNYDDVYTLSDATNSEGTITFTSGGYVLIDSTTWLNLKIKSFANITTSDAGTADITATYYLSDDGGDTWGAELTETQFKASTIILGKDYQFKVKLSADSGTLTKFELIDIEYDEPPTSDLTVAQQYAQVLSDLSDIKKNTKLIPAIM